MLVGLDYKIEKLGAGAEFMEALAAIGDWHRLIRALRDKKADGVAASSTKNDWMCGRP
jgi:hypothetical protein